MNLDGITINGTYIKVSHVRELQKDISLDQVQETIKNDGLDSIVFEQNGKAYLAWSDNMDFSSIKNLKQGEVPLMRFNGKEANLVLFENEITSAGEGAITALNNIKNVAIGGATLFVKQGIGVVGGALTLGGFASLAKGVGTKAAYEMIKPVTGAALKGLGRVGLWGAGILAAGSALYTGGMAIYGGVRKSDPSGMISITKPIEK